MRYLNGTSVVALLRVDGDWHIKVRLASFCPFLPAWSDVPRRLTFFARRTTSQTGVNFSPILITIDD